MARRSSTNIGIRPFSPGAGSRRKSAPWKPVLFVLVLAAAAGAVYWVSTHWTTDPAADADDGGQDLAADAGEQATPDGADGQPDAAAEASARIEPNHFLPPPADDADAALRGQVQQTYRDGVEAHESGGAEGVLRARRLLSEALASSLLADSAARDARRRLTEIAEQVVFSRRVFPGDPHAYQYEVPAGYTLSRIVAEQQCYVPYEGIMRVNGMRNDMIRAGQTLKIVRGPFHAIVTKRTFTLDLYQQDMFVKSYRVGLGSNGSTPVGL